MTEPTASPSRADAERRWPADPAALADATTCPACFAPLSSAVCGVCGLDLRVPEAIEVLAAGRRLYAEEQRRRALIDGMFRAQRARGLGEADASRRPADAHAVDAPTVQPAGRPAVAPSTTPAGPAVPLAPPSGAPVPLPPPTGPAVQLPSPVAPAVAVPPMVPPSVAGAPTGKPRRSGVQVLLLTLGVVLISVTAIVFLFVAYLVASLEVRSVIIAFASVLVLGAAALLRRRGLPGTAEGVSAVAVVLLLLDVWIVRANGLFGSTGLRPAAYAGAAILVVAGVLAGVRALSGIRVPGVAAAALAPTALFVLGVGVAPEREPTTALWLGGLFALAGAIAAALVGLPRLERVIAVSIGVAGGGVAWWSAAFAMPGLPWHPLWSFVAVAVAWAAVLGALETRGRTLGVGWRWVAAIAVGGALAAAPATAVALEAPSEVAAWLAPTSAALVALVVAAFLRVPSPEARRIGVGLLAGAGAVAVLAAIPAGLAGALHVGTLLFDALGGWSAGTVEVTEFALATVVVPSVLAVTGALVALEARRLRTFGAVAVALAGDAVLMLAVTFGDGWPTVAILLILAAACLVTAILVRTPLRGLTPVLAAIGFFSAALAWAAGFGAVDAWLLATFGVLALTVVSWRLVPRRWPATAVAAGAVFAALTAVQLVVAAAALAPWLRASGVPLATDWRAPAIWVALMGATAFAAALTFRLPKAAVVAFAAPALGGAVIAGAALLVTGSSPIRWIAAVALAAGTIAWCWRGRVAGLAAAAAAVAPLALTFAAAWFVGDVLGESAMADTAAAAGLLVAAAIAHLAARAGGGARVAWVVACGAGTLLVAGLALAEVDWLPLALLAPVPLVLAALWGDPIASAAPARHLAWSAPVLAVAAWWTWLVDDRASVVELFTLPVAALCLAIGAVITLRRPLTSAPSAATDVTPSGTGADGVARPGTVAAAARRVQSGRTTLIAIGLAVVVLPSVAAAGDSAIRTILLVAAGAVALLATAFAPESVRGVPIGLLGVSAGAAAAVGGAGVHATALAADGAGGATDWWASAALLVGVATASWWAWADRTPRELAEWLYAVGLVAGSLPMFVAILARDEVTARATVLTLLFAVVHVLSVVGAPRPFAGLVARWTSFALMMIGLVVGVVAGVDPLDVVIAPFAVALIVAGVFDLRRNASRSSWSALGPGLGVLLVPPLIADFTDPQLWRIVTLGVVAVLTLLAGIRWKLQAPFVLGAAVLLVHAIAQLWPWITWLYEAVWWWLWLGLAGVLLVAIAATYERQLRLARTTVARISSLR
jgi:hypothetical protein